jgi:hypothetical protein
MGRAYRLLLSVYCYLTIAFCLLAPTRCRRSLGSVNVVEAQTATTLRLYKHFRQTAVQAS